MSTPPGRPIEPPSTRWQFPPVETAPSVDDLVAIGADMDPGTLLSAYRAGYFPMPLDARVSTSGRADTGWWSPDPRGILEPRNLRITRSLRRSCDRFDIRVNKAFDEVITACADPRRPHGWISGQVREAYRELHRLGWVHSIEAWDDLGLAGGLYGVSIGGLFAGESMFHRRPDASKVALVALVDIVSAVPDCLIDVQWSTPHLESLGATELDRSTYAERLRCAVGQPGPPWDTLR